MIYFFLIVNRQCQTRFSRYYEEDVSPQDRPALELAVARQCMVRKQGHTLFFDDAHGRHIVYRAYSSLYFIIGCDATENIYAMLELIQHSVETLDTYFEKTELDIIYNLEKVHVIMDEIILKGLIHETNQERVLSPVLALTRPSPPHPSTNA